MRLVHEETNWAIRRGDQKRHIDERHVIADEKRAGSFGEVVAAKNFDAVDGMGDEEEDETAKPLREQDENVDRAGCRDDRGGKHDAARIEMDEFCEYEVRARRESDTDERQQVGGGDDAALVLFGGAMLDGERVHGNREKAGQKPSVPSRIAEPMRPVCMVPSAMPVHVMPMEPSGMRPYSILLPLSRPAIMLPMPMPMASVALR